MKKWYPESTSKILVSILSLTFIAPSFIIPAHASDVNPSVYPTDSSPFGTHYKDWIAKWWQWNVGIPASQHPRDHYSPEKCTVNQNGSVWFLPDILTGKEDRSCTIASDKGILVPLLTGECENSEGQPQTDVELKQCSMAGDEFGAISATLDGKSIENLNTYRTDTGFFNITIVKDNIFDTPTGTYRATADGFFVFLKPLSPGNHELHLKTSVTNPTTPSYNYASEGIYHLIIKP
jgi:hypothetical protein